MQSLSWQEQLAQAIRQPEALLNYIGLEASAIGYSASGLMQFPLRIPHVFADRMQRSDPDDPLLRQVFPYQAEDNEQPGFIHDPLSEVQRQTTPGLIQKYQGRVLSIATGACAIHCRYCFRRHYPYSEASSSKAHWQKSLEHIRQDKSISEVILSGGDPLTLSDAQLLQRCESLAQLKHIKRIRFHTRVPVVLPARLSRALVTNLAALNKTLIIVLHINHANEIDQAVSDSISLLREHDILVLNQSVLLRGVNDDATTLISLSEKLVANQVTPYYLHLLDPVAGAAHFDVLIEKAESIMQIMRDSVSGYLLPRLVKEIPELSAKQSINY